MRSKASCKGHPIHPALIPFPFAFLYGAFFFDLAGRLTGRPSWWTTGAYAFDDRCTHRGGSLAGGVMIGGVVQCPWHGSQFDCSKGTVKAGPAERPIESYPVTEKAGKVTLRLG